MKPNAFVRHAVVLGLAVVPQARAASIDVNQVFDYTCTTEAANTAIAWSALTWSSPPTWGPGVTAGIPNGAGTTSLARTYTVDVEGLTLKQLQFYNADAITLQGGTIAWDSGEPGVQAELGRNRHTMTNYAAGRNFILSPAFVLNSDLRVTNWVEARTTTYNCSTSGPGKLTLRLVPWLAGNVCAVNIGGTAPNTHEGGTTLVMPGATMNVTMNKADAFGSGLLTLSGGGVINLNLNSQGQTAGGLSADGAGAHVIRNGGTSVAALTLKLKDGVTTAFGKQLTGPNLDLVIDKADGHNGTGVQLLSGSNSFSGATTVNGASLRLAGAQALAGSTAVNLGSGGKLYYDAAADVPLALPGTLTLTGGAGTVLGTAVGAGPASAAIAAAGVATASGQVALDIAGVAGTSPAPGSYTLVSGGAGSTLDAGSYVLGTVWNATSFKLGAPAATAAEVKVEVTAAEPLPAAWWKGGFAGQPAAWAASDGNAAGNWTTDAAGTAGTGLVPGGTTSVTVAASGAAGQESMVLGAKMAIRDLAVTSGGAVGLLADGNTLTITPSDPAKGLEVAAGAGPVTIGAGLELGAEQTWHNGSAQALTVNGVVAGAGGLRKTGPGVLVLGGTTANTFTGGATLEEGVLHANKAGALGGAAGTLTIKGGTTLDNTSGAAVTLSDHALVIDGDFTFAGSGDLSLGSGFANLGNSPGTARTVTVAGGNLTIGGEIAAGATAESLVKAGAGTLTLRGYSSYPGETTVAAGTLAVAGSGSLADSAVLTVAAGASFDVSAAGPFTYALGNSQTLRGNGTVVGNLLAASGSVVAPGASTGTLAIGGDLTLDGELRVEYDTAAVAKIDRLDVAGRLDISPTATIDFLDIGGDLTEPVYVVATYGSLVGAFEGVNQFHVPAGYRLEHAYQGNKIALVSGTPPADPFAEWIANPVFGLPAGDQDPEDDPDLDGASNLLEFALNGNPADATRGGLLAVVRQDANGVPGEELTLVAAARRGAVFAAGANGRQVATLDGVSYTAEGSLDLAAFTAPVEYGGASDTAPAGSGLPDLTGSAWQYHAFRLAGSDGLPDRGFLRLGAAAAP